MFPHVFSRRVLRAVASRVEVLSSMDSPELTIQSSTWSPIPQTGNYPAVVSRCWIEDGGQQVRVPIQGER